MEIKQVPISELKFAEYNPRQASEREAKDLTESIQKYGIVDPIIVNKAPGRENVIIGGHFRVRIAKALDMKEVPVYYLDLSLEEERELNLRLNRNTGRFDYDLLSSNFTPDLLLAIGFTEGELGLVKGSGKEMVDRDNLDKDLESYLDGNIRQIVLYFKKEEFDIVIPKMDGLMKEFEVENHTFVFLKLLEHYENSRIAKEGA